MVEREGSVDAVRLRAVAREVGIAAPSIYPHFADVDALVAGVQQEVFARLSAAVAAAADAVADPVERLVAGTEAYVGFGLRHPAWYRAVFARPHEPPAGPTGVHDTFPPLEVAAFNQLVASIADCVAAGRSRCADPFLGAVSVWVALHGVVSLWSTFRDMPWPDTDGFVRRLTLSLAEITG